MFTPIHKTISVSDFQRKAKVIFQEVNKLEQPTVIMNHNKPVSIVMSPEVYEKMIEDFEDLFDLMQSRIDDINDRPEDYVSWDVVKKELNQRRKESEKE